VSRPGRGNFKVWPGSHIRKRIDGPPRRDIEWPDPQGATEACVNSGNAVFFDRRLWHARSGNYSQVTRKAMFFGYTLPWIATNWRRCAPARSSASSAQCAYNFWAGSAPASTARRRATTCGATTRTPPRYIPSCPSAACSTG